MNVFGDISPEHLLRDVDRFAHDKGLSTPNQIARLKTGALIARYPHLHIEQLRDENPDLYGSLYTPNDNDRRMLKDERSNAWTHKKELRRTIILCSIAATFQGWDQAGSNCANTTFPQALGIPTSTDGYPALHDWLVGLINAAPFISSAFLGCWLSDPINFIWGRRGCTFFAAIFCTFPIIGSAFAQTWGQLFACRLLLGIGMGAKATTVPIYMAENSPKAIRGALVMGRQTFVALGIFLGFTANLVVSKAGKIAWRLQFGSAFIPAILVLLGVYFCPESPRWYMKKNRYDKAYKSLKRLRNTKLQAARDLYVIHTQLTQEPAEGEGAVRFTRRPSRGPLLNYFVRISQLFSVRRNRQATFAALTVMIAQQMCGINIIAFYSSTIFKRVGDATDRQVMWLSWGFGLVSFLFALPVLFAIDGYGRRALLLLTFPQLAWTLFAAGPSTLSHVKSTQLGLVTFFVFLFTAFYSTGEGPVPFVYSAEVFPLSHRELGMGLAVTINLLFAAILSLTFPAMLAVFHPVGAFQFYAGLNIVAFIMIFLLVPETGNCSLEHLDIVFDRKNGEFSRSVVDDLFSRRKTDEEYIESVQMSHIFFPQNGV